MSDTISFGVATPVSASNCKGGDMLNRIFVKGGFCATLFRTTRKSLILNGEMSEWLKEHAWKLTPAARADAYEIPPTHARSTTSRSIDTRRRVPVDHDVCPGFRGYVTQF